MRKICIKECQPIGAGYIDVTRKTPSGYATHRFCACHFEQAGHRIARLVQRGHWYATSYGYVGNVPVRVYARKGVCITVVNCL